MGATFAAVRKALETFDIVVEKQPIPSGCHWYACKPGGRGTQIVAMDELTVIPDYAIVAICRKLGLHEATFREVLTRETS